MDTSTPLPPDLRRKTLLNNAINANNASSPLRRSLNISNTSTLQNASMVEISNDDDERADRRNQLQIQKRLSNVSAPKAVNLSESFISEQFMIYSHWFSENKINSKNAWKVQIIDMLKPLCHKRGQDALQVASTSIDISAKVYGIRVDDIHSEGLKLASSMARVSEDAAAPENDDDAPEEHGPETPSAKLKKKKKKRTIGGLKATVNRNPKGNLGKLGKLEPVDFSTRVNADSGTIDNLFTNALKQSGSRFVLLDKEKRFLETLDTSVKKPVMIDLDGLPLLPVTSAPICAGFKDFVLDEWDPEHEKSLLNPEKLVLSQVQPVIFDDKGFPIPELDGSINDNLENFEGDDVGNDEDHVSEIQCREAAQHRENMSVIVDFRPTGAVLQSSEYSFNSVVTTSNGKYIDQIWAGPSHWKLKFLQRSVPKFSGQKSEIGAKLKKQRKKTSPEMVDLDEEPPVIDFSKILIIKKKPKIDIDKITLPIKDQSCAKIMADIKELILRPGVCVVEKNNVTNNANADGEDFDVSPYNYENPNDSLYCSQSQPHDDANDGDADDVVDEVLAQQQGNLAENLVENPEMVPNTYISYALRAKQMNMKNLKKAIWNKLTNSAEVNKYQQVDKADLPQVLHVLERERSSPPSENAAVNPQKFSDMYKALPSLLQQKDRAELSCPLAFVALLHLCNDNNLELRQLPGYKDFTIKGPSTSK